jgi:hypothetical protein
MSKWRDTNYQQPEGVYILNSFFDKAEDLLKRMGLRERLDFHFSSATYHESELAHPSYKLIIGYGDLIVLICYYELDIRFGLEVTEAELMRVEDLLANMALTALITYGVMYFIRKAMKTQSAFTFMSKESDDKKFLPLN